MHPSHRDPLDTGEPQVKAWEEFRATFSSCLLQIWLLDELDEVAPEYFADLESRLFEGLANADALAELDEDYDGAVPLQSPNASSVWFIDSPMRFRQRCFQDTGIRLTLLSGIDPWLFDSNSRRGQEGRAAVQE